MMQPAEDGDGGDGANPLDRAPQRRILLQRQARTGLIVLRSSEDLAQMRLAKNDDLIQAFAANRANQMLCDSILPR